MLLLIRHEGKIKIWDVVNEALSDGGTNLLRNSLWTEIVGPDFIAKPFQYAHEAETYLATLDLPIHITELDVSSTQGGQRGFGADIANNAATTQGGLVRDSDRKLAEAYAALFRAFLKHDESVKMVTFWGQTTRTPGVPMASRCSSTATASPSPPSMPSSRRRRNGRRPRSSHRLPRELNMGPCPSMRRGPSHLVHVGWSRLGVV